MDRTFFQSSWNNLRLFLIPFCQCNLLLKKGLIIFFSLETDSRNSVFFIFLVLFVTSNLWDGVEKFLSFDLPSVEQNIFEIQIYLICDPIIGHWLFLRVCQVSLDPRSSILLEQVQCITGGLITM